MKKWKCVAIWCRGKFHCVADCENCPQKCVMSGVDVTWDEVADQQPPQKPAVEFKSGDKVRVVDPASSMNGKPGIVFRIEDDSAYVCFMLMPSGIYKFNQLELAEPAAMEEPPPVPDWCKVGAWVWIPKEGIYRKIKEINFGPVIDFVAFGGGENKLTCEADKTFFEARMRPWNDAEMKAQVGKIFDLPTGVSVCLKSDGHLCDFLDRYDDEDDIAHIVSYSAHDFIKHKCTMIDGSPCGVLEHLEDGKWVE